MRLKHYKKLALVTGILFGTAALAETAVIVHPSNGSTMSKDDISLIYLGKTKQFPNGSAAVPLDRAEGSKIRISFVEHVVGKNENQMKSYWSRLIFTGKGVLPEQVESGKDVKKQVASDPKYIGYIDSTLVDETVKVIYAY